MSQKKPFWWKKIFENLNTCRTYCSFEIHVIEIKSDFNPRFAHWNGIKLCFNLYWTVEQRIELIWQSKALRIHVCFSALQCPNSQSLSNPLVQFTLSSLIHMTGFNPCTYLLTFVIHFYSNWNEYHMHTRNLPWCIFYQIFNSMYADRKIFKWYCKHSFWYKSCNLSY